MLHSIDGQDREMILFHVMSGYEDLPDDAIIWLHANDGVEKKALFAQLVSYGMNLPNWNLSDEQASIITSLLPEADHTCALDAVETESLAVAAAVAATAAEGSAAGFSLACEQPCKGSVDLVQPWTKLLAGCKPSPLTNLAAHAMTGGGTFVVTIQPELSTPTIALDLEELGAYGSMTRNNKGGSLDVDALTSKIGKLLSTMGGGQLFIGPANAPPNLKITAKGEDNVPRTNPRGKSTLGRPGRRKRQGEENAAAPLRDVKAKRKAAAKAAEAAKAVRAALNPAAKADAAPQVPVHGVPTLWQLPANVATEVAADTDVVEQNCGSAQPQTGFASTPTNDGGNCNAAQVGVR